MASVERRLLEWSVGRLFHEGSVAARAAMETGNGTMRVRAGSRIRREKRWARESPAHHDCQPVRNAIRTAVTRIAGAVVMTV